MMLTLRGWMRLIAITLGVKLCILACFLAMAQSHADDQTAPGVLPGDTSGSKQAAAPGEAKTTDASPGDARTESVVPRSERPRPQEEARRTYLERIVAPYMSHEGASWLVRPERQAEENAEKALSHLGIVKGMTICDLGCGNGYWTLPLARAVGEEGKVYAVDIQPEMLRQLRTRAGKAYLRNIKPVLGAIDDPKIPDDVKIDLLLLVDVYHEFSHPESMLWAIRRSLADDGVIALLEYREEDPNVPIKPVHKMSKRQILIEYKANGFKLVRECNDLPWQHLMFFARDDSSLPEVEAQPYTPAIP